MNLYRARLALSRGLKLKCPHCGVGALFQSIFQMRHHCAVCGLVFEREQGYFVGAIYINVIATEFLIVIALLTGFLTGFAIEGPLLWLLYAVALASPLLLYRHSRSFWLNFDHFIDPESFGDAHGADLVRD